METLVVRIDEPGHAETEAPPSKGLLGVGRALVEDPRDDGLTLKRRVESEHGEDDRRSGPDAAGLRALPGHLVVPAPVARGDGSGDPGGKPPGAKNALGGGQGLTDDPGDDDQAALSPRKRFKQRAGQEDAG
jgi:hypothetical protein